MHPLRLLWLGLAPLVLHAAPASAPHPARVLDYSAILDGNQVACFIGNGGLLAHDHAELRGRQDGFYFPDDWPAQNKTLIYSSGLWLAGIDSQGDTLVALCDYSSECGPGGWGADPADPAWRVYLVDDEQGGWDDWPVEQGAPLAAEGEAPWIADLPGVRQMAWAVWNDGDPANHVNIGGSTDPLGVEVRLTAWCGDAQESESTVFLRWEVLNQGSRDFDQLWAGFWVDADLGGSADDLAGCAPGRQLGFTYNGDNDDAVYGSQPPALGAVLLHGLHEPAAGDSAYYQAAWHAGERNLPLTSFTAYHNGWDSQSFRQTLFLLQGRRPDGQARPDGFFDYAGNPVEGAGTLDPTPCDRRILLGCGPVAFAPGQRQELGGAICATAGADRLASLDHLFQVAPWPAGPSSAVPASRAARPSDLRVICVRPNPFNPETVVELALERPAHALRLSLHDLAGRECWSRELGACAAGLRHLRLQPDGLASGLYLLRVEADGRRATAKLLLLR